MKKNSAQTPVTETPVLKAKAKKVGPKVTPSTAADAPKAAKAQATKAETKEKKEAKASKYVSAELVMGRRMRVAEYQDHTFSINDQPNRRLTDEELCADWQRQFPHAVHFETFHVRGARRDFNAGLHSKAFPGKHESVPYVKGADGKAVKTPYTRAVKPAAPKGEATAPKASDAAKVEAAKKAATVAKAAVKKSVAA